MTLLQISSKESCVIYLLNDTKHAGFSHLNCSPWEHTKSVALFAIAVVLTDA